MEKLADEAADLATALNWACKAFLSRFLEIREKIWYEAEKSCKRGPEYLPQVAFFLQIIP